MNEDEGYENCKECKGNGYVIKRDRTIYRCKSCAGIGKIDWIQKVIGNFENQFLPCMQELVRKCEKKYNVEVFVVQWNPNWAFVEWLQDGRFIIIKED